MKKLTVLFVLLASLLAFSASADACETDKEIDNIPAIAYNYQLYKAGDICASTAVIQTLADYGFYELADVACKLVDVMEGRK